MDGGRPSAPHQVRGRARRQGSPKDRSRNLTRATASNGDSKMRNPTYAAYKGAEPYFNLVRRALGDLVDGEHFFDIVADKVVYEVLYEVAGWPRVVRGRADLMAQFGGYCDNV